MRIHVSIESADKLHNSPGRDILFSVVCEYGVKFFYGYVYVSVVVYV